MWCLYNNQILSFLYKLNFYVQCADMIIAKGVPFLIQAG